MNWLTSTLYSAKDRFVKACRYYWYGTHFFEAEDQDKPLWHTQYANSVILYFNNIAAAQKAVESATIEGGWVDRKYKYHKIQQGSKLLPRIVRVIFHN